MIIETTLQILNLSILKRFNFEFGGQCKETMFAQATFNSQPSYWKEWQPSQIQPVDL